jgi:hypothetical protein
MFNSINNEMTVTLQPLAEIYPEARLCAKGQAQHERSFCHLIIASLVIPAEAGIHER